MSLPGHGKLHEKTIEELWEEYRFWNNKIATSRGWGAALAAAAEFRADALRELKLRGESVHWL